MSKMLGSAIGPAILNVFCPEFRLLPPSAVVTSLPDHIRLSARERAGIRRAAATACRETSAAWKRIILFGSRTDPARRGGDIDLLVEIAPEPPVDTYRLKQRLRLALEDELGSQRFDLVLDDGTKAGGFADLARSQGVELWSNS